MSWQTKFKHELDRGLKARADGNEGMARVCARRAAGEVVRAYYQRQQTSLTKSSVLHVLRTISQSDQVSPQVHEIATHFIWQITTEHTLPGEVDLLDEAQWLAKELLGEFD